MKLAHHRGPASGRAAPQVFYINRDRDGERRRCIEAGLTAARLAGERVPAVEGLAVPHDLQGYFMVDGRLATRLSAGEVGCYASHLKTAQLIWRRGLAVALVVEDDAVLPSSLAADLDAILNAAPQGWDIIRLSDNATHSFKPLNGLHSGREIVCYSRVPSGTVGYLISAAGARKLLEPHICEWPVDTDFRQPWVFGLQVYGVLPKLIGHNDALPSAVLAYGERSRLRRGLRRPTLRYPVGSPFHTLQSARFNLRRLGPATWLRCWMENMGRRLRRWTGGGRRIAAGAAVGPRSAVTG